MRDFLSPGQNQGQGIRRITWVPSQRADANTIKPCEDLHCLNPDEMPSVLERPPVSGRTRGAVGHGAGFCKESAIQLQWTTPRKAGSGLINLGNTCFMNSVLQCLTHTPPLAELCLQQQSLSSCADGSQQQQLDPIAATQAHIKRALTSHTALQPKWHARNLKAINRRFRLGRQEDAHEYLRCVLDAMHEAFLRPMKPKPPPELAATTFVQRIFGGKLRSQIMCEGVDYSSSTFDPFLDLSLEINKANSLTKALAHFTAPEVLDGDNRYRCPTNNKLVRAYKRISIDDAPNVLTIHLKRFDFFGRGHKLSKRVEFELELDLGPYMTHHHHKHHHHQHLHHHKHRAAKQHGSSSSGGLQHQHSSTTVGHKPVLYDLYAVLVHHGHSLHSGHYVCYVKAGNGIWHLCDDHRVAQVSQRVVEGQQAYILFYVRRQHKHPAAVQLVTAAGMAARAAAAAANRGAGQLLAALPGSDSTRTPLTAAAAGAAVAAGAAAAAAAGRQQAATAVAGTTAGQSGSASAAEGQLQRKVVTSSTESTANASPGSKEPLSAGAVDSAPLVKLLHHHHHFTRSRPPPLTSFERHMQLHRDGQRQRSKMRHQQLRGKQLAGLASMLAEHVGLAAAAVAGKNGEAADAAGSSGGSKQASGLAGSKRSRAGPELEQPQSSPFQQLQAKQGKQQATQQQEQQQEQPSAAAKQKRQHKEPQAEAQQQEQQQEQHHHHHKRDKHADAPSSQQQQQQPSAAVGSKAAASAVSSSSMQQQAQRSSEVVVTGAAALDLLMGRPSAAGAAAAAGGGWEGGGAAAAAGAAVLQRAGPAKRAQRDEWDVEYDRGKVKKVRKPKQEEEGAGEGAGGAGNRFQSAWDEGLPQKGRAEAWKGRGQQAQQQRSGRGGGRGRGGGGRGRGAGGRGGIGGGGRGGRGGRGRGRGRGRGGPRFSQ